MEAGRKLDSRALIMAGAVLMAVGVLLRLTAGRAAGWYIDYMGTGDTDQIEVFTSLLFALDSILIPLGCALVAGGLVVVALRNTLGDSD